MTTTDVDLDPDVCLAARRMERWTGVELADRRAINRIGRAVLGFNPRTHEKLPGEVVVPDQRQRHMLMFRLGRVLTIIPRHRLNDAMKRRQVGLPSSLASLDGGAA